MMTTSEKLDLFIKEKYDGSVAKFAESLGINRTQVYTYLTGKSIPSKKHLMKLKELGCDILWLLDDDKTEGNNYIVKDNQIKYNSGITNIGNTTNGGKEEMVNVVVNGELTECKKLVQTQEKLIKMLEDQISELKKNR